MTRTSLPLTSINREIDLHWDELQDAVLRVLKSGRFILGPEVQSFEDEIAEFLSVSHAIGVGSGTDALVISLRSLGIGHGDEVITTPFSFVATAESIVSVGADPVFVDIDPKTFNISPRKIEMALSPRTKAILPVHLFGYPAEMDEIYEIAASRNIFIVEDAAQAFGAYYKGRPIGNIGHAAAFSFFPSKNLGAVGDCGLITTNDEGIARKARMLRSHGGLNKNDGTIHGYNSRLDEIQAAVLRTKLRYINEWTLGRQAIAAQYDCAFQGRPRIVIPAHSEDRSHVYHQYTLRLKGIDRNVVQQRMSDEGIQTNVYYHSPIHMLPAYSRFTRNELPETELASHSVLSIPITPFLSCEEAQEVSSNLLKFCHL